MQMFKAAILLCVGIVGLGSVLGIVYYNDNQSIKALQAEAVNLKSQISTLNDDNAQLVADNTKYMKHVLLSGIKSRYPHPITLIPCTFH